jgi:hypothetical protein
MPARDVLAVLQRKCSEAQVEASGLREQVPKKKMKAVLHMLRR